MKKLKQTLRAAGGLVILTTVIALLISPSALSQSVEKVKTGIVSVLVVNDASSPVPVAGTVNVSNTDDDAVPVRDVGSSSSEPIQLRGGQLVNSGIQTSVDIFVVPSGKRLVVEDASAQINTSIGGRVLLSLQKITASGERIIRPLNSSYQITLIGTFDTHHAGEPVVFYVNEGETVAFSVLTSGFGSWGFNGTIAGYLIDLQ